VCPSDGKSPDDLRSYAAYCRRKAAESLGEDRLVWQSMAEALEAAAGAMDRQKKKE
jgi:hypothetical protein